MGMSRRWAAMARTRGRPPPQTSGEWDGGGIYTLPKLTRGVSLLQPLIGNLVDCCSVGASMGGAVAFILFLRTANILNCVRVHVCPCLITCERGRALWPQKKEAAARRGNCDLDKNENDKP